MSKVKEFIVEFEGRYLVREPYWDAGVWTYDLSKATRYSDKDFFSLNHPNFKMLKVDTHE